MYTDLYSHLLVIVNYTELERACVQDVMSNDSQDMVIIQMFTTAYGNSIGLAIILKAILVLQSIRTVDPSTFNLTMLGNTLIGTTYLTLISRFKHR